MKNNVEFKKCLLKILLISIFASVICFVINNYEYDQYTSNFNSKLVSIINLLKNKYPDLSETGIIEVLNQSQDEDVSTIDLKKYGMDIDKESIVIVNDEEHVKFRRYNILFILVTATLLLLVFWDYIKKRKKGIDDIIKCLEQIRRKNYKLNVNSETEDELSVLKSEIAKIFVQLKEITDNTSKDRENLKKSLDDISHQLKTPITSILINLDNLISDPDMEVDIRNTFVKDIKREVLRTSFLVQEILKLSKFDSHTISFSRENIKIENIIDESIKNVSSLCDLKNISIEKLGSAPEKINCDFRWQVEAITNVIKNGVEHSRNNNKITVKYRQNKVYTSITIKDFAGGIDKSDLPHIFERFYTSKNSSKNSVGIGLALAKAIIEEDNGKIWVDANNSGSVFTIRYYNL